MHEVYLQYGVYYVAFRVHGALLDGSDVSVQVSADRRSTGLRVSAEHSLAQRSQPSPLHTKAAELAAAGKTCPRIQSKVG